MENLTDTPETTPAVPDQRAFTREVRRVARALSQERAAAFTADDIGPREVRLLHLLASDRAADLPEHLPHGGKRLRRLAERGWATETDGTWTLTEAGRAAAQRLTQHLTHRREEIGTRLAEAVSADELASATTTLEAVARALDAPDGDGPEGHPRHRRHGFGPGTHGFGPGAHGFGPGAHGRGRAHHGEGCRDHAPRQRDAESAYERGFAAGFSEGRTAAGA